MGLTDNEPWFVGKDVAVILGYANPNEALSEHVDVEDKLNSKTLSSFEFNLGQRGGWLINESGLYSLVMSSKLPGHFKKDRVYRLCVYAKKAAGSPSVDAEASRVTSENAAVQPAVYKAEASNPYIAQSSEIVKAFA